MKDLQLIHELCESRVFRTKQSINKFNERDKRELFYGILLSTIALAQDTKTNTWAEKYAGQAAAFGNFDYFRTSGTDLYILTYVMQNDLRILSKPQAQVLVRMYRSLSRGSFDRSFIEQTLLRMERILGISNTQLRNARRTIVNWIKSNETERKQAVTRLHRFIRTKAKLAEVLPFLLALTKGEKGHFGKWSPLKKAAAVGAAALGGFALGYKLHDPNKRWKVIDSTDPTETPLTEDRATQLFALVQNLKAHPDIEKVISVNYIPDGISAFVRDTEGNAYEFEIRPAPHAKGHEEKRGVTERLVGLEDGETQDCWSCKGSGRSFDDLCLHCMGSGRLDSDGHAIEDEHVVVEKDGWICECVNITMESEENPLAKFGITKLSDIIEYGDIGYSDDPVYAWWLDVPNLGSSGYFYNSEDVYALARKDYPYLIDNEEDD